MQLSIEFFFRLLGAVVFAILLGMAGDALADGLDGPAVTYIVVFTLIGVLTGLVLTPYLTTRPVRRIRQRLISMSPGTLGAVILGIFMGLIAAALLSFPLSFLPSPLRQLAPVASALLFSYLAAVILTLRQNDLRQFFRSLGPVITSGAAAERETEAESCVLLDTSVIIDGRIADISKTGFIRSTLLVPNFVLSELQHIADSSDSLRRNRGRRGLEVLGILQQDVPVPIQITDMDVTDVRDVDSKLVALARDLHCPIMTNDYNLNRVAELQGVPVLNINDLANAVKAAYLPGEELSVKIIQEGKEYGQGVGYLEDGTMVVIEEGVHHIGSEETVVVTKVLQTTAGRMIFARF
ncbi:MAG: hypothetical protein R3272_12165 [Candidatus Promineifilaceae bacterium]|nr:hypothetical protein [Candidatus Promineifilaceae bacterium]